MDSNNVGWIGIFQVLFEVVSGYGTVGLTYGNPSVLPVSIPGYCQLLMGLD